MIVRAKPTLFEIAFALRGSILPRIIWRLAAMTAVSALAVWLTQRWPGLVGQLSATPFALIGLALSIFMSFRNNACYDRWWEARKLWGELIIACRGFARQTSTLSAPEREPMLRGLIGFTYGLNARLRGNDEVVAIAPWSAGVAADRPNPTDAALSQVGDRLGRLMQDERLTPIHYSVLELRLGELTHVQAACERIKNTPLPFAYSLLLHRTAHLFCLFLPFALAPALGWWTPLLSVIVGYAFFGLDALGDELEDPFGEDDNDLALDAMSRTVERELLDAMGVSPLPDPVAPVRYHLT